LSAQERTGEEAVRKEVEAIEAAYTGARSIRRSAWPRVEPGRGRMMRARPKRNNPPEGAPRACEALAHAARMVAQAMRRETKLEKYQRQFVREPLKRAVGEIGCLLESAWLGGRATPREREALHFDAPMSSRRASGGVSSLHPPSSSTG
jgi:hypothetical protein